MGHPRNPLARRLDRHRCWPVRHPSPAAALRWSLQDPLVRSFLRPAGLLAGSNRFWFHPFGRGRLALPVADLRLQQLGSFLHRRSRRYPFHPLFHPFGHRQPLPPPAVSLPPLVASTVAALDRLSLRPLESMLSARFQPTSCPLLVRFSPLGSRLPPAVLLVRFLVRRLARGYPLLRLVNGLLLGRYPLLAKQGLLGLLLRGRGRFTRAQMASSTTVRRGPLPLATVDLPLDGGAATVYLKYGACTLRLWFTRR